MVMFCTFVCKAIRIKKCNEARSIQITHPRSDLGSALTFKGSNLL